MLKLWLRMGLVSGIGSGYSVTVVQTAQCGDFDDYPIRLVFVRLLSNFFDCLKVGTVLLWGNLLNKTFLWFQHSVATNRIRDATYLELCDKSVLSFSR